METYELTLVQKIHRRNCEVKSAARQLAAQGRKGIAGDTLPDLMSGETVNWINNNPRAFRAIVESFTR